MSRDRGPRRGADESGDGHHPSRDPGVSLPESWDAPRAPRQPARVAPIEALAPEPRRPTFPVLAVGAAAVVIATAAAAAIAWQLGEPPGAVVAAQAPAAPAPVLPATASAAPAHPAPVVAPPSAAPSAPASASTAPSSSSSAPATPSPASVEECFAGSLPEGALGEPLPDLSGLCTGEDGYKTMLELKAVLVRVGAGGVTPAMSEWSALGWYETAAFAILRAHCCPDAPVLKVAETFAKCRMDESLAYLVNALDDDDKMREAREAYFAAAKCIAGTGWGGSFAQYGFPHEGELKPLDRILERVRKARGR